ncbi:HMCN1 [Symbiodinium natans]|uniref:HMCN1 protein n=1 Tax=Symbiodinium natans TaxID=878477 RepID=A0A812PT96_9DINO|nr:HMCN1 [Symbiodinium natans]
MAIVACNTEACPAIIRDCEFSKWNDWQDCSLPCGGGQQHRSRVLLIEASEGGKPCQGDLEEFHECNTQPCTAVPQVDCAWGEWARWSDCSALCNGHQERHRSILALAEHGGKACEGPERVVRTTQPGSWPGKPWMMARR